MSLRPLVVLSIFAVCASISYSQETNSPSSSLSGPYNTPYSSNGNYTNGGFKYNLRDQSVYIPPPQPVEQPLVDRFRFKPAGIFLFKRFECSNGYGNGKALRAPVRNVYSGMTVALQDNRMELKTKALRDSFMCDIAVNFSLIVDDNVMETTTESTESSNCTLSSLKIPIGFKQRYDYKFVSTQDGEVLMKLTPQGPSKFEVDENPCFRGERLTSVFEEIFTGDKEPFLKPAPPTPPKIVKQYIPKKVNFQQTKYCLNESALDKLPKSLSSMDSAKYIVVSKKRKRIYVIGREGIIGSYVAAFGSGYADGPKEFENDGRTPEGLYSIVKRTLETNYHNALVINYPNKSDLAYASEYEKSAGGGIMIHGFPDKAVAGETPESVLFKHPKVNWTLGCMAVTDPEIEAIYSRVAEGTPVEICPL